MSPFTCCSDGTTNAIKKLRPHRYACEVGADKAGRGPRERHSGASMQDKKSIQNTASNPYQVSPSLNAVFCSCISTKVEGKADARKLNRTETLRINLAPEKRALDTAILERIERHALNLKRALERAQLEPAVQKLYQRHARLFQNRSLDIVS